MIFPRFVDHLVFRVADLEKSERFYSAVLGSPAHHATDSVMYVVGDTRLFFTRSVPTQTPQHDKEKQGLNHLAFGIRTREELLAIEAQLDECRVKHSGVCVDHYGNREFIWLDDPDEFRIEFYLRPVNDDE